MATKRANRVIAAALRDVNVLRISLGMEPLRSLPKGNVGEAASCPIANALGSTSTGVRTTTVHCQGANFNGTVDAEIYHTPAIRRFIEAFDNGRYPALKA